MEIFIACSLLGFGVGLAEAPLVTYIGEITYVSSYISRIYQLVSWPYRLNLKFLKSLIYFSEASVRGVMMSYSGLTFTFGLLFVNTLNTLMPWRTVALTCMFVPISAVIGLFLVC